MKLNLGCGDNYIEGWINLEVNRDRFKADFYWDLEKGVPFPDNSADEIYASHIIEHLSNTIFIMKEIYRVLKPGSIITIRVPQFNTPVAIADPSHKTFWSFDKFKYFCKGFTEVGPIPGIDFQFEMVNSKIDASEIMVVLKKPNG